jgi:hypothetical protein
LKGWKSHADWGHAGGGSGAVQGVRGGRVARSRAVSQRRAWWRSVPHISLEGFSPAQKVGRSGRPKTRHRIWSSSWMQASPAGLPRGISGRGEVIEGAMQQAPQPGRQAGESVIPAMMPLPARLDLTRPV